jgi:rhomboid family GlyGly-CTERM serine protease
MKSTSDASLFPTGSHHFTERRSFSLARALNIGGWILVLFLVNLPLAWGGVRDGLIFLPEAVAAGQWWRVISHPLVHLSWYHLLLDAAGFLILYAGMEEKRTTAKAFYLVGAGTGSLLLAILLDPAILQQGLCGLSGIAHGLMAIAGLEMLRHRDSRTLGFLSLAAVTLKSAWELWSGHVMLEFMHMGMCGSPLAASHAGGVIGGVMIYALIKLWDREPYFGKKVVYSRRPIMISDISTSSL